MFEKLHSTGYTYNDLKADNVCIGDITDYNPKFIKLIDFSLCSRFKYENGDHKS